MSETLSVGEEDTGITNVLFSNGCTMNDQVLAAAAAAGNHGGFVSAVAHLANGWRGDGVVTNEERAAIQQAAAHSKVGE